MTRSLNRHQILQNRAFLKVLERTGNIRAAVRETGLKHGTMFDRRAKHPAFAQRWDAAIAVAQARLLATGGVRGAAGEEGRSAHPRPLPEGREGREIGGADPQPHSEGREGREIEGVDPRPLREGGEGRESGRAHPLPLPESREGREEGRGEGLRTRGGEPVVVRRRDGKLQVRRAQPGKITQACEQAFLAALSATANVRLAAAAAGASPRAFYRRKHTNPGFAREMRLAITMGYERVELALLENMDPREHADDAWRHNDPPPIPPMSVEQAIQLLYHHRKTAKLAAEHPHLRRRPGESWEAMSTRLALLHEARMAREREKYLIAEAARRERGAPSPFEPEVPPLPDLAQVTGWSKASGKPAYGPEAGFGGWRIEDMRRKLRGE